MGQNKKYLKNLQNFSTKRDYTLKVTQAHESYFA